jgi:hypothetical protein
VTLAAWALRVGALGCLTGAAWLLHPAAGLVVAAGGLLSLEHTLTTTPRR